MSTRIRSPAATKDANRHQNGAALSSSSDHHVPSVKTSLNSSLATAAANNKNGETFTASSPSRTGFFKPKRSMLDAGRLCLLRSRGKTQCWFGLLIVGSILSIMNSAKNQDPSLMRMTYSGELQYTSDGNINLDSDRVFSHDISSLQIEPSTWSKLVGTRLFQRAQYQPKPLMMGFILSDPSEQSLSANYNLHLRKASQLSSRSKMTYRPTRAVKEQFQVARIHTRDHRIVDVVSTPAPANGKKIRPSFKKKIPVWSFTNTLVRDLGNGMAVKNDIDENSKDYDRFKPDDTPKNCKPQYEWQTLSYPNCNALHETDVLRKVRTLGPAKKPESVLLARGGYRDVWSIRNNDLGGEVVAMKTLLYEHPWTERNMDRHRRDALATDRLTGSPYALNLYGYCANTGLYDFADGGSLEDILEDEEEWEKWTIATKMKYAYQVACAIADVHNIDHEGLPSMSHTDISTSQFVSMDGGETYKINDFNRARFLYRKNNDPKKLCKFEVASNKGKFRSPEEYAYKPETAAIDNYSMGNIFYVILTGEYPFPDLKKDKAQEAVMKGQRPEIPEKYLNDKDPMTQALIGAIRKLWIGNPEQRATSREIQQHLKPFAEGITKENGRGR